MLKHDIEYIHVYMRFFISWTKMHQMSRVYQCLLLLLLSLVAATVSAQKKGQARLDSLRGVLPLLAEDSTKVRVLNSLSFAYNSINPTEGIKFGKCPHTKRTTTNGDIPHSTHALPEPRY